MLPNENRYQFRPVRLARQTVSLGLLFIGCWYIGAPYGHGRHAHILSTILGMLGIALGLAVNPGTLGDDQVHHASQRSLAAGIWRDTFGSQEACEWTIARLFTTGMTTLIQLGWDRHAFNGWVGNGASLVSYTLDRAWGDARVYRAPMWNDNTWSWDRQNSRTRLHTTSPSRARLRRFLAFALNFLFGNVLDTAAGMFALGGSFLFDPAHEQVTRHRMMRALSVLYMGTIANQLWTSLIAQNPRFYNSVAARIPGHLLRLGARHGMRAYFTPSINTTREHLFAFFADGVSAFTMHRWPLSTPRAFWAGLHLPGSVEGAPFLTRQDSRYLAPFPYKGTLVPPDQLTEEEFRRTSGIPRSISESSGEALAPTRILLSPQHEQMPINVTMRIRLTPTGPGSGHGTPTFNRFGTPSLGPGPAPGQIPSRPDETPSTGARPPSPSMAPLFGAENLLGEFMVEVDVAVAGNTPGFAGGMDFKHSQQDSGAGLGPAPGSGSGSVSHPGGPRRPP